MNGEKQLKMRVKMMGAETVEKRIIQLQETLTRCSAAVAELQTAWTALAQTRVDMTVETEETVETQKG